MASTPARTGRWIVVGAAVVLVALALWIALRNDLPNDVYHP